MGVRIELRPGAEMPRLGGLVAMGKAYDQPLEIWLNADILDDGQYAFVRFLGVLAHEMVHICQFVTQREQSEEEAEWTGLDWVYNDENRYAQIAERLIENGTINYSMTSAQIGRYLQGCQDKEKETS